MKIFICTLFWLITLAFLIESLVIDMRSSIAMANLQLADDASTPEVKAKFIRAFLDDMDKKRLPEYAAWVWTSERNKISNQKIVLESLAKRCDDLSAMDKQSYGYAQGITQVSGQEFDHALGEVRGIYEKAYTMSYGWLMLNVWWLLLILTIGITGWCVFTI